MLKKSLPLYESRAYLKILSPGQGKKEDEDYTMPLRLRAKHAGKTTCVILSNSTDYAMVDRVSWIKAALRDFHTFPPAMRDCLAR